MRCKWHRCGAVAAVLALAALTSCGDDPGGDDPGGGSASSSVPFTLGVFPEFVQGAIPGAVTGVLVTVTNETETTAPVEVTASAVGGQVSVEPGDIRQGEVAEVTVIPDDTTSEQPLEIVVTGRRGAFEQTATRSTTVFPWEDDRGAYATQLLDIFTAWLAEQRPDLGIDSGIEVSGSFVAPGLLVVSHYLFLSGDWELGLSWHVMLPPDDWAEIYLRPRTEPAPTLAFRMASQQAAIQDGVVTIDPVTPPREVVR